MKHLYIVALLLAAATTHAQVEFKPRRCLHATDSTLITHSHSGIRKAMSASTADGLGKYGTSANGTVKSIGTVRIPVIMTEFSDVAFLEDTTPEKVSRLFNEPGYHDEPNCVGSIRDYFVDNSNGLFTPEFVVVGQVMVSHERAYYGQNSKTSNNTNVRPLIQEAVELAQGQGVNFADFIDGTGVPMVIIYHAGQGEHNSYEEEASDYLWAHYAAYSFTKGGVKFNSYFVGNETRADYDYDGNGNIVITGTRIDGSGVLIHELGHALGLPDIYSTNSKYYGNELEYKTPDWWSVMDYGEYYGNACRPVGLNAYEKSFLGWLDIKELTQPGTTTLAPGEAALVRNKDNANEYFVLENRQTGTWYPEKMGSGMLVMHVDYNSSAWSGNKVNYDASHLRCRVLCADGEWTGVALDKAFQWDNLRTDLYGYLDQPDGISATTTPAWCCYTGTMADQPIYNIVQKDNKIEFSYIDDLPTGIEAAKALTGIHHIITLDGRRVLSPTPRRIYIVDGHKVIF